MASSLFCDPNKHKTWNEAIWYFHLLLRPTLMQSSRSYHGRHYPHLEQIKGKKLGGGQKEAGVLGGSWYCVIFKVSDLLIWVKDKPEPRLIFKKAVQKLRSY